MRSEHNALANDLCSFDDGSVKTGSYDLLCDGVDAVMSEHVRRSVEVGVRSGTMPTTEAEIRAVDQNHRTMPGILSILQNNADKGLEKHVAALSLVAMAIGSVAEIGGVYSDELAKQGAYMFKNWVIIPLACPNSIPRPSLSYR